MTDAAFQSLDIHRVSLAGLTLIEASAGTGKTWTISGLYLRLLLEQELAVDRILVVTFTKAATAELQARIRKRLVSCLAILRNDSDDAAAADEFCSNVLQRLSPEQRASAPRRLAEALSGFDQAAIHTIHGFCQRVLNDSAFESGADFDCELQTDDSELLQAVVEDFWRKEVYLESGLWIDFLVRKGQSPQRWFDEIKAHLGKPFLRVVPAAVPEYPEHAVRDYQAAFERLKALWADGAAESLLLGFRGFDGRKYRKDWLASWLNAARIFLEPPEPGLTLPARLEKLTPEALADGTKPGLSPPDHPAFQACRALLTCHRAIEQRLVDQKIRLLAYCNTELPRRLRDQRLLSFSEMLNRLAEALDGESGAALAGAIRARYPAALIDEFQDTDPVQYRIFHGLYGGTELPAFLVGDPKQAIYHFRGADVFSYLKAHRDARAHFTLDTNFRSVPGLIEAVNALFDEGRHPAPFLLDEIRYRQVKAAEPGRGRLDIDGDGPAPFRFLMAPAGHSQKGEEAPLGKGEANQWSAESTAREIARLLNLSADGKARIAGPDGIHALHGGDIAVLVPSHRQGDLIRQALLRYRIPSVSLNRASVFETAEAHELQRVLWAIAEPTRARRVRTALATECLGCSGNELAALLEDETAFESRMAAFQRYHEIWQQRGFMPMFGAWLAEEAVADRLLELDDGERRLTNLRHLAELLQAESRTHGAMDRLLGWYSRMLVSSAREGENSLLRLESDAQRVKIVTVHASKGLEFPVVFCPFLWDGRLLKPGEPAAFHDAGRGSQPTLDLGSPEFEKHRELAGREKLGEQLRQLYVALTRAEYRCYVVWGRIKEMETAALSWLLHGSGVPADDPVAAMKKHCDALDLAAIETQLRAYAARAAGAVVLCPLPEPAAYRPRPAGEEVLFPAAFNRPPLFSSWRISSFTGLSTGRHSEAPDYDAPAEETPLEAGGESMFAFPRGATAGSCLHAILEDWDFTAADGDRLGDLCRRKLKAHGLDESWTGTVRANIENLLTVPLNKSGLRLTDISPDRRLVELEFTFTLTGGDAQGFRRLLADPALGADPRFAEAARALDFRHIAGYMKGYIDLVFEADGRFYLADYKSNWLGNRYADYAPARLADAMAREHYYLQYLIYTLALHRYLKLRLPGYGYGKHFGGAYYLFLRGIDPRKKTGVFWDRPSEALVECLERLLAG